MDKLWFNIKKLLAKCYNNFIGNGWFFLMDSYHNDELVFVKSKFKLRDVVKLIRNYDYDYISHRTNKKLKIKNDFTCFPTYEYPVAGTITNILSDVNGLIYVIRFRHDNYIFVKEHNLKKIKFKKITKQQKRNINKMNNDYVIKKLW